MFVVTLSSDDDDILSWKNPDVQYVNEHGGNFDDAQVWRILIGLELFFVFRGTRVKTESTKSRHVITSSSCEELYGGSYYCGPSCPLK